MRIWEQQTTYNHECDRKFVYIHINTKAKATGYLGAMNFTSDVRGNGNPDKLNALFSYKLSPCFPLK